MEFSLAFAESPSPVFQASKGNSHRVIEEENSPVGTVFEVGTETVVSVVLQDDFQAIMPAQELTPPELLVSPDRLPPQTEQPRFVRLAQEAPAGQPGLDTSRDSEEHAETLAPVSESSSGRLTPSSPPETGPTSEQAMVPAREKTAAPAMHESDSSSLVSPFSYRPETTAQPAPTPLLSEQAREGDAISQKFQPEPRARNDAVRPALTTGTWELDQLSAIVAELPEASGLLQAGQPSTINAAMPETWPAEAWPPRARQRLDEIFRPSSPDPSAASQPDGADKPAPDWAPVSEGRKSPMPVSMSQLAIEVPEHKSRVDPLQPSGVPMANQADHAPARSNGNSAALAEPVSSVPLVKAADGNAPIKAEVRQLERNSPHIDMATALSAENFTSSIGKPVYEPMVSDKEQAFSRAPVEITGRAEALLDEIPQISPDETGLARPDTIVVGMMTSRSAATALVLPPAVGPQLVEAATAISRGTIEIALSPEELGQVRMTLAPGDNGIHILIQAERPETLELMRRNIDELLRDFRALGYVQVDLSFGDGRQPRRPAVEPAEGDGAPAVASAMPRFIGAPVTGLSAAEGLDIRF